MEKITLDCEIITPMFLGGADGKIAELRTSSIKGALRFWWRAMHGNTNTKELLQKETKLFGGGGDVAIRSKVVLRVLGNPQKVKRIYDGKMASKPQNYTRDINTPILKYLSIGTYEFPDKNPRESFTENQTFKIIVRTPTEYKEEVLSAFNYLSSFGGLGSKSRNGFGSFKIKSINSIAKPYSSLEKSKFSDQLPKFYAFSRKMRLFKTTQSFNSSKGALEQLGDCYRLARIDSDRQKHIYENRVFLAAPLGKDSIIERHAKPFFMSVRKENNNFTGYLLYLPSEYVDDVSLLKTRISKAELNSKYSKACDTFLEKLLSTQKIAEVSL